MPKSHSHGSGGHSSKNKDGVVGGEMTFTGSDLMKKRLLQRKSTKEGVAEIGVVGSGE